MKQVIKKSKSALLLITVIGVTLLAACTSPSKKVDKAEDEVNEAQEELTRAQDDYRTEVDNFKNQALEKIVANEKVIADFTSETAAAPVNEKSIMETQVATFKEKNTELKARMSNFKEDEKEKWESFKTEFNHDMTLLGTSLRDFTIDNED